MFLVCGEAVMDLFVTGETPTDAQLDARTASLTCARRCASLPSRAGLDADTRSS